jgi:hypothetical protein
LVNILVAEHVARSTLKAVPNILAINFVE